MVNDVNVHEIIPNAICLALMKVLTFMSHFCSLHLVVTFSLPLGEENVTTSQNVEAAGAKVIP